MSKSKAPAILLNKDFFSLLANKKWIKEQGDDAIKILLSFWIESSKEPNCKVKREDVELLDLHVSASIQRVLEVLDSAVKIKLLNFRDGFYFNSQIVEDQDSYKTKAKNYSEGRKKAEQKKLESSENPARIQLESSENPELNQNLDPGRMPIIPSISYININSNKKEYHIDLPCLKLEREEWDAWLLNFHHGNEVKAREMCVAASDYRQAEGKGLPDNSMSYLRQWFKRSAKFDQPKIQITNGKQETPRPQPKEVAAPPPRRQLTPEEIARNKKLTQELLNKTTKGIAA